MEKIEFYKKIEEVAKILNMQIEQYPERYDNFCFLVGEDDIKIAINEENSHKSKLKISSSYPVSKFSGPLWYPECKVEINISNQKSPLQIANDIKKRFLPNYLKNLEKIKQENQRADNYIINKKNNLKKIADYFSFEIFDDNCFPKIERIDRISAFDDKKVEIKLRVEPELAIKIIEIIQFEGK